MTEHPNTAKKIANILLNLPAAARAWLMENVAPSTLGRWSRQGEVALRPYRNLKEKVLAITTGKEPLSELAIFEKKEHDSMVWWVNYFKTLPFPTLEDLEPFPPFKIRWDLSSAPDFSVIWASPDCKPLYLQPRYRHAAIVKAIEAPTHHDQPHQDPPEPRD